MPNLTRRPRRLALSAFVALAAWLPVGAPAVAQMPAAPGFSAKVGYSADTVMEAEGHSVRGRIHYDPRGVQRMDSTQPHQATVIMRFDRKVMITYAPSMPFYIEMPIPDGASVPIDATASFNRTPVGRETINGVETTRYAFTAQSEGTVTEGDMWESAQGVPMRTRGTARGPDGTVAFSTEFSNVVLETPDPALFEAPAGYSRMPGMPALPGLPAAPMR